MNVEKYSNEKFVSSYYNNRTCHCITSSSLIALPEPGIDGLMSKCCPLISFVRIMDNGLSVFIELGQICLSLFARSTFSNYFFQYITLHY